MIYLIFTAMIITLSFLSGYYEAMQDVVSFRWDSFVKKHPEKNNDFYNPTLSYKNKYKNNDPKQGPKFWQSTGLLVSFTDAWHRYKTYNITFFWLSCLLLASVNFFIPNELSLYGIILNFIIIFVNKKLVFTAVFNSY